MRDARRMRLTMTDINAMPLGQFMNELGWIFENSPWVAEAAWNSRPFANIDRLHAAMIDSVQHASRDRQLALLRAHPDLGLRGRISAASQSEQSGAGLDQLTPDDHNNLVSLNQAYRDKFGFPFLLAVKGSSGDQILSALEQRLHSPQDSEFLEALSQVYRIAGFRLLDTVAL